ncbi:hypothetical protein N7490_008279 [Penicillium lividum]|nr:hypothetical protein N7490_008279 [Penicillium lividum]
MEEEAFIVESMYQSLKSEMETSRSAGDSQTQQPDDPRIRRPLLRTHNELSGQRPTVTPAKRSTALHPQDEEPVSPITIPEKAFDQT